MAISNALIETSTPTLLFLATGTHAITTIFFCNTDVLTDTSIDVYVVPAGNVVTTNTLILKSLSLPAAETFVLDAEKLILDNGDEIWAQAADNLIVNAVISSVSL